MDSHKNMNVNKFKKPTNKHFLKGLVWNFQKGKLCGLLMANAEKWGAKINKCGDTNLLLPNLYVLPAIVFPTFSVFKVVCHEHAFAYAPSAVSVML